MYNDRALTYIADSCTGPPRRRFVSWSPERVRRPNDNVPMRKPLTDFGSALTQSIMRSHWTLRHVTNGHRSDHAASSCLQSGHSIGYGAQLAELSIVHLLLALEYRVNVRTGVAGGRGGYVVIVVVVRYIVTLWLARLEQ